jgi:hypothetical protein
MGMSFVRENMSQLYKQTGDSHFWKAAATFLMGFFTTGFQADNQ